LEPSAESYVKQPPTTLGGILKQTGPGIVLAGTIVGSGELLLTTGMGAKHGFTFLWLVLFSCVIKVFVQIELGRYAISSGQPTLQALRNISSIRWIGLVLLIWWAIMLLFTVFQLGGMAGGVAQSVQMAYPNASSQLFGYGGLKEYLSTRPEVPWACLTCLVTILLIFSGKYRHIEFFTTILVVGVTLVTVLAASLLFVTDYAPSWSTIAAGLTFKTPPDGIADAFAVFGITGVGATELFYYPYWCIEKGYARFVGPNDGTAEWETRAKGWIKVMHFDAWISMLVFTLSTLAFYAMGAAVLHPQGLVPKGTEMISALSEMYKGPFGNWTQTIFLIGAGTVLFKTLYLACAANSRMMVDFLGILGAIRSKTAEAKLRWVRVFCVLFPSVALVLYLIQRDPQLMVRLGGMAQAATLPMMAFATLYFRYVKLNKRLQPYWLTDVFLWIACLSILFVAVYSLFFAK
jgi:manganese transport protein